MPQSAGLAQVYIPGTVIDEVPPLRTLSDGSGSKLPSVSEYAAAIINEIEHAVCNRAVIQPQRILRVSALEQEKSPEFITVYIALCGIGYSGQLLDAPIFGPEAGLRRYALIRDLYGFGLILLSFAFAIVLAIFFLFRRRLEIGLLSFSSLLIGIWLAGFGDFLAKLSGGMLYQLYPFTTYLTSLVIWILWYLFIVRLTKQKINAFGWLYLSYFSLLSAMLLLEIAFTNSDRFFSTNILFPYIQSQPLAVLYLVWVSYRGTRRPGCPERPVFWGTLLLLASFLYSLLVFTYVIPGPPVINEGFLAVTLAFAVAFARSDRHTEQESIRKDEIIRRKDHFNRVLYESVADAQSKIIQQLPHELRIKSGSADYKSEKYLGYRLYNHLEDVRDYILLVQGEVSLSQDSIDLRQAAEWAIEVTLAQASAEGIPAEITHTVPEGLTGFADRAAYRRVLVHALHNAIRYGKPPILVRAMERDAMAVLVVQDSGDGYPEEILVQLQEPLRIGEADVNETAAIGLSLIRRFIDAMKGRTTFANDPGAVLEIEIPLQAAAKPAILPEPDWFIEQPTKSWIERAHDYLEEPTILIVCDNRETLHAMAHLLRILPYKQAAAFSLSEGRQRMHAIQPALTIVDALTDAASPAAMLRFLREVIDRYYGQVLLLNPSHIPALQDPIFEYDQMEKAAMAETLTVPYHPETLVRTVNRLVQRRIRSIRERKREEADYERELAGLMQERHHQTRSKVPFLQFSELMVPLSSVGGDLYEILNKDDVAYIMHADANGHGVPASILAAKMAVAMRLAAEYSAKDLPLPDEVLTKMNLILLSQVDTYFITAGIVRIFRNGEVRYGCAGHTPLIIKRAHGGVETLRPMGTMLGVTPDIVFRGADARIEPGDYIILMSDGLVEAGIRRRNEDEFGMERMLELIAGLPATTPEEIKKGILSKVESYAGGGLRHDDVSMLILQLKHLP